MTITFEIASSDTYLAVGISPVSDPHSVYDARSRAQPANPAAAPHTATFKLDSADFSGTSLIVAAALTDSDLRIERIASLRQSIAHGTYRVSAATVADSVLKAALVTA